MRTVATLLAVWTVTALRGAELSFDHDGSRPLDIQQTATREQHGALLRDITYASLDGTRNAATIITGEGGSGPKPAVLFVHWYGPPATS